MLYLLDLKSYKGRQSILVRPYNGSGNTVLCTTSFHPPFGERCEISNSVRASMLSCKNLRDRPPPQCHDLCLNIVRFPPVRYYQISSAIAETTLYSRFGGGMSKRHRKRKRMSGKFWVTSIWFSWPTRITLQGNQNSAATAVRYNYYVQLVAIQARLDAHTEFEISQRSPKGGWKLVVHIAVPVFTDYLSKGAACYTSFLIRPSAELWYLRSWVPKILQKMQGALNLPMLGEAEQALLVWRIQSF